jgi:hypothetical protein
LEQEWEYFLNSVLSLIRCFGMGRIALSEIINNY